MKLDFKFNTIILSVLCILLLTFTENFAQEDTEPTELLISKYGGIETNAFINKIIVQEKEIIWIASNQGLYLLNPGTGKADLKLDRKNVTDVIFTNKDIWSSYGNKIESLNTGQIVQLPYDGSINDLCYINGQLWIGSQKGLYTYLPSTARLKSYNTKNSKLKSNHIHFIHHDRHDITWIGTEAGYIRIDRDKWEDEDEDYRMLSTYENKEGQWIISEDEMVLINEYNRLFPVGLDEELYEGDINDFAIDKDGKIYLASNFLVRYDPYQEDIESFKDDAAFVSGQCTSIEIDNNNNVWIGTGGSGLYLIKFSDNISNTLSANIIIENPISCHGEKNASLQVIVSGGQPPYTYNWEHSSDKGDLLKNLSAGQYTVSVKDHAGTQFRSSIKIAEPKPLVINNIFVTQISRGGVNDGQISIQVEGGTGDKQIDWSHGANGHSVTDLGPGKYIVTITDNNGCNLDTSVLINGVKILQQLDISQITVGSKVRLESLTFDADSSVILPHNYPILDEVFDFLVENNKINIEIGGHTNTIPPHSYCDKLSSERARNVAHYLYDKGITEDRISFVGYGKRQPLTEDRSLNGRKLNQRVEIKIVEM